MNTISRDAYEGDLVSRLRNWRGLHIAHSGRLYEEAADEIERLRERVTEPMPKEKRAEVSYTLTAEEREAIEIAIPFLPDGPYTEYDGTPRPDRRATLRGLLERLK